MSNSTPISTTHDVVVITYDEANNRWLFTLRGRDRTADSLAKAREAIDAPVKEAKDKPFKHREAWLREYDKRPVPVTVTGTAIPRYGSTRSYWIKDAEGERSKTDVTNLFAKTPENDTKAGEIIQLFDQIEELERKRYEIKLSPFTEDEQK